MHHLRARIADHNILFKTNSSAVVGYLLAAFGKLQAEFAPGDHPDLSIEICDGFGSAFADYNVKVHSDGEEITFARTDYKIVTLSDFSSATIFIYNDFALKHALVNLYSSFIVHRGWGLLVHSSCLVEGNRAFLFAGQSGAGKSTVARLSFPRPVLSDEATIVKIDDFGVTVFNSPFRSDTALPEIQQAYSLQAIHLLRQASYNKRSPMGKLQGMIELLGRVFYWAHEAEQTKRIARMCSKLTGFVPIYELFFQKNRTFWEEISNDEAI